MRVYKSSCILCNESFQVSECVRCFRINSELEHTKRLKQLIPKHGFYSSFPAYCPTYLSPFVVLPSAFKTWQSDLLQFQGNSENVN